MGLIDEIPCKAIETEYKLLREVIDFAITLPEQYAIKIESYCLRIVNVVFQSAIEEINFWRNQIVEIIQIIKSAKYFKNVKRICNDLLRCSKFLELAANKPSFGNKSLEELKANEEVFRKYVCNGEWLNAALALLDSLIAIYNAGAEAIRSAITVWTGTQLNAFLTFYNNLIKKSGLKEAMAEMDAWLDCVFGLCAVGDSVKNFKEDLELRMYMTRNGQVDKKRYKDILELPLIKLETALTKGDEIVADAKARRWDRISKDTLAHPKSYVSEALN